MSETSADVVNRYLQDAITGEKNFEARLAELGADESISTVGQLIGIGVQVSHQHQDQLTQVLSLHGAAAPAGRGLLAQFFEPSQKSVVFAHHGSEPVRQDPIAALGVGHRLLAMYEVLATMAEAAGDSDTAAFSKVLRNETRRIVEQLERSMHPGFNDSDPER